MMLRLLHLVALGSILSLTPVYGEATDDFEACLYQCSRANPLNPGRCVGLCVGTNRFSSSPSLNSFVPPPEIRGVPYTGPSSIPYRGFQGIMPDWTSACRLNDGNPLCSFLGNPDEPAPTCTLKIYQKWDYAPTGWTPAQRIEPTDNPHPMFRFELTINGKADYADIDDREVSSKGGNFSLPIPSSPSIATVSGPGGESQCRLEGTGMNFQGKQLGDAARAKCTKAFADTFCKERGWGESENFTTVKAGEYGWGNCTGPRRPGCFFISTGSIPQERDGDCSSINCLPPK